MDLINLNKLPEELKENVYALSDNFFALDKVGEYKKEHNKLLIEFTRGDRNSPKCKVGITDAQIVEMLLYRSKKSGNEVITNHLEDILNIMNDKTISEFNATNS